MTLQPTYGPHNPHPLSQLRTELVWEGKYDEYGNRREVDMAGCAMPMQRIESIDEPRREAAANQQLTIFEQRHKRRDDFRNRLIWGDNKLVMASLLKEFRGKVDLIYIDPPFDVGADFTLNVAIGDGKDLIEKDQSTLEMVAYRDIWGRGADSFINMLYERLTLMRCLLSDNGSIYVHCDWRTSSHIRLVLDEVFGKGNHRNEIIWCYKTTLRTSSLAFGRDHDSIHFYAKSNSTKIHPDKSDFPSSESTIKRWGAYADEKGFVSNKHFAGSSSTIINTEDETKGFNIYNGIPRDWWEISANVSKGNTEEVGAGRYPTQKPEALLERIIKASSNEGDLVADFFCGSGTTGAVAERLGRRWLMADLGRFAIHTTRKRMIELQRKLHNDSQPYRAFDVYNLGRYERQWWQRDRLQGADTEHRRIVLEFFKAEPLTSPPSPLLHGRKAGAFCHVDNIDSIFTRDEATQVAQAVKSAGGRECYCLAWEFEMDLHLRVNAIVQELGVKLKLVQIPREIMEKNRTAPPPFLEVALLAAEPIYRTAAADQSTPKSAKSQRTVDIKLTQFLPSLAEVPTKELEAIRDRAIKSGFDFIDFWAIDFNWQPGKAFNHDWQDYRTHKDRSLKTVSDASYTYPAPGQYIACVKVVDTFGCDTSITIDIEV
jgi:adenine-specific DNA-methyltransferase